MLTYPTTHYKPFPRPYGVFSSLKKASKIGDEIRKNTNNCTHSFVDRWLVN
ncbi:MAG: hypothetical protein [Bacteriophage sp.]|nr:MAG: hypothetical protein [Bacteriophage sp.]